MHVRMAFQPAVVFRFVRVQVVQYNVQFTVRIRCHNLIHEIQKLSPAPPVVMARDYLPSSNVEAANNVVVPCRL